MHIEEVKRNAFYKMPKWLFKDEKYKSLPLDSKVAMMFYWDLLDLSIKNNWHDDDGTVYVKCSNDNLAELLNCSKPVAIKAKKKLVECGLIRDVRQGVNQPNKIYILTNIGSKENLLQEVKNLNNGSKENLLQEVKNLNTNKTEYIKTNISRLSNQDGGAENTDSVNQEEFLEPIDQQQQHSIFDEIQENFGRGLRPVEYETVKFMLDENPKELVSLALKRAILNGKPSINYMDGILRSWRQKNITTVLEAEQELNQTKSKQPTNQTTSSVPEWSTPDFKEETTEEEQEHFEDIKRQMLEKLRNK